MIDKKEVRQKALDIRNRLGKSWREEQSEKIMQHLQQSGSFQRAGIVLSYSSIRSEVETRELNKAVLRQGKELYLPKTYPGEKRMAFYPVQDLSQLNRGYQGILEPEETVALESQPDICTEKEILMLMPGVAFDEGGYRLGYGGGYYDRYLCRYGEGMTSMFLAFEEQKISCIPAEAYDVKPDIILTQKGIRKWN